MQGCLLLETVLFCQQRKYELEEFEISIYSLCNNKIRDSE